MKELLKGRKFQFWEYRVSHGSLFLRSPMDGKFKTNIDVKFVDVMYVAIPRFLYEIDIVEPTEAEIKQVKEIVSPPHEISGLYIIKARGRRFPIAGTNMMIEENELNIMESVFREFRERDAFFNC